MVDLVAVSAYSLSSFDPVGFKAGCIFLPFLPSSLVAWLCCFVTNPLVDLQWRPEGSFVGVDDGGWLWRREAGVCVWARSMCLRTDATP